MDKKEILGSLSSKGNGEIYLGVVGAVRTGKSTFIKKVIENIIVPNIEDEFERKRCLDEIPQTSQGKQIMTIEPKFVPSSGAKIKIDEFTTNMKLIDCVGFITPESKGYEDENGNPRMVRTPWFSEELKFVDAATLGTEKVIKDHSTIGIVVTTDGSIGEFNRSDYQDAEERVITELKNINNEVNPNEILLVVDSMTGQDAVNVIEGFNEALDVTGAVLTKLDGDTKGGAALSIRHLTNIPIKFIGVSEKMDGLEKFSPSRMASRILDMGDLMGMAEKAEALLDDEEAMKAAEKMSKGKFDLEDFLVQLNQIKKLGPLENLLKLIPGAKKMGLNNVNIDPKQMAHIEAIILSMTPKERRNPDILKASRKKRIAAGSGRSVEEVNRLLKQFEQMKDMMKRMKNGNMKLPF